MKHQVSGSVNGDRMMWVEEYLFLKEWIQDPIFQIIVIFFNYANLVRPEDFKKKMKMKETPSLLN